MGREDGVANQGSFRKILRGTHHYLCYHFVLSRSSPFTVRASGFRLKVVPTVFPPHSFFSSNFFAGFIGRLDLKGKNVADVGTGSGILALAAARSGAASVLASDINPNAAYCAAENAAALGFSGQIQAVCCDVMSALAPCPLFDVIFSSPPMHAGKARDLADAGWHAGADYSGIALFFEGEGKAEAGRGNVCDAVISW
jgi:release factor glutamine methyltransferase